MNLRNQQLACCECKEIFTLTAGEALFFSTKGLEQPKRCPSCRKARKAIIQLQQGLKAGGAE